MMNDKRKSNSTITHKMVDGKIEFTVLGAGLLRFDPDRVSAANRARAMIHGFVQRISDGGAMSRNPETGLPATPADKLARMTRIAEHLMAGGDVWELKAAAGPGVSVGLVIQAMIALGKARDADHANELISKLASKREIERDAAVKLLAEAGDIKVKVAEIRAEQAAVKVNSDDLLDSLDDEPGEDEEAPF
jgi:hypothetical protein